MSVISTAPRLPTVFYNFPSRRAFPGHDHNLKKEEGIVQKMLLKIWFVIEKGNMI